MIRTKWGSVCASSVIKSGVGRGIVLGVIFVSGLGVCLCVCVGGGDTFVGVDKVCIILCH